jgi:hypothetical protein
MRRTATRLIVLVAGLLPLGGCKHDDQLKPPKMPPEWVLPPANDPRFSTYPKFPEKTLNDFPKRKDIIDPETNMPMSKPKMTGFGGPGGGPQ